MLLWCVPGVPAGNPGRLGAGLTVTVSSGPHGAVRGGMVQAVALEFENQGEARMISVSSGPGVRATSRFSIPAGARVARFLYVPLPLSSPRAVRWCEFRDADTGESLNTVPLPSVPVLRAQYVSGRSTGPRNVPSLACLKITDGSRHVAINTTLDGGCRLVVETASADMLPGHWRGLSGVDVMVAQAETLLSSRFDLGPAAEWMAMGGVLLVPDAHGTDRTRLRKKLDAISPFSRRHPRGLLVGMGGMAFVQEKELRQSNTLFFSKTVGIPAGRLRAETYFEDYDRKPEMPFEARPPFWPVLFFLALFAVGVGPLGWWYLVSRKGMGLLYYVAAPALCAVVMAIVVVADLAQEGFRPYLSCRAVRFIDQKAKRRIDLSQFGIYAPVMTGGRLVGQPGEVPYFVGGPRRGIRNLTVRTTEGGQEYVGALPARRKSWYGRAALEVERRRLVVGRDNGGVWVENHLGCDLRDLVVAQGGSFFAVSSLEAGEKKRAEPTGRDGAVRIWEERFRRCSTGTALRRARVLQDHWQERFLSGHAWAARVEAEHLQEQVWLRSRRPQNVRYLIFGVF